MCLYRRIENTPDMMSMGQKRGETSLEKVGLKKGKTVQKSGQIREEESPVAKGSKGKGKQVVTGKKVRADPLVRQG